MKRGFRSLMLLGGIFTASVAAIAVAQEAKPAAPAAKPAAPQDKDAKPAAKPADKPADKAGAAGDMQLPPGWTAEDMQACMMAGIPGEEHKKMAKAAGTWNGKCQMWMGPTGGEPMRSDCVQTIKPMFDGRYLYCEMNGEFPGMGPFKGIGYIGFDNVSKKWVGTWLDSHSTGIMSGTGEQTADGKTMNWKYTYNCPINKKPTTMRQVEGYPDDNTSYFEMYNIDPKSGKEYKSMRIDFTRAKTTQP